MKKRRRNASPEDATRVAFSAAKRAAKDNGLSVLCLKGMNG